METQQFNMVEARRESMMLGLRCGLVWIISFLLCVYSFPSSMSQFAIMFGLVSVPLVGISLRRYRRRTEGMSWLMALWMAWCTLLCSALLCTLAQYVYFAFLDDGRMLNAMMAMIEDKEVVSAYTSMGLINMLNDMHSYVEELATLSAKDMTMSLGGSNLFIGLFLTPICSLFAIGARKMQRLDEQQND